MSGLGVTEEGHRDRGTALLPDPNVHLLTSIFIAAPQKRLTAKTGV